MHPVEISAVSKNGDDKKYSCSLNGNLEEYRFRYTHYENKSINTLRLITHKYRDVFDETFKTLCNLNIKEILDEVSTKDKIMPEEVYNWVSAIYNIRMNQIKDEFKLNDLIENKEDFQKEL